MGFNSNHVVEELYICLATAVLAGYGIGKFDSIEETVNQWVRVEKDFYPDMDNFKRYGDKYRQFLEVYQCIEKYMCNNRRR
jgi:sugar (pentulose or hexulose) kinase